MNKNDFKNTRVRLTIIFTLLVLSIAILLEIVFFTGKYYNYVSTEKKSFIELSDNITNKFLTLDDFLYNFNKNRGAKGMGLGKFNNNHEKLINLLIINRTDKTIVFSNLINDINKDLIYEILSLNNYNKLIQKDGFLIKKVNFESNNKNYDLIYIKNLKYSFVDYLKDLFGFIIITFIFSILFYYIGLKFVSKNLKPVEESMDDMKNFIHNAGHELKTPISIIHGNLQLINEIKKYDKQLIDEGLSEINRLDKLIESLVELSNISSAVTSDKLDLGLEIKEIIKDFQNKAIDKDIKIKFKTKSKLPVIIKINKQYFYILFSNILGNAIKYNNKGGKIDIVLDKNKLIIKDNGIGIKKDDLDKIFDRFYMSTNGRKSDGHGIGLSLVKKIANIYNMKINVNSEEGKGTEFTILF